MQLSGASADLCAHSVTLDGDVRQLMHGFQALPDRGQIDARIGRDGENGGVGVWADAPDVEVCDLRVAWAFNLLADFLNQVRIGRVEQDARRIPHQAPRPAGDDDSADNAHGGIEEGPSGIFAGDERDDCQDRRQRVGEDVEVGGAEIVVGRGAVVMIMVVIMNVVMVVVMPVMMVVAVMVMAAAREQGGADKVHQQAYGGDNDGLIEGDNAGRNQALG